ncbi:MAG: hypothetical protein ABSG31_01665 [Tepidisphaeraceae bacterium]|jgi:hypothetical protein
MTLNDLYDKAAPALGSHSERIKFFGWYLHVHGNLARFSQANVRVCYDEVNIEKPGSLAPWFKSLCEQKPKQLLPDQDCYRLERAVRDHFTKVYGGKEVAKTQTSATAKTLEALAEKVIDSAERGFIEEAITCINHSAPRAAIVLGWCAAVHRLRKKIQALGFPAFNETSARLKNMDSGKHKRWSKEFRITSFGELQTNVFDTDLITILEGMGLIDGTQAQRLATCFEYRCHSAHPGDAPIGEPHVVAFFSDIVGIILSNPVFA